MNSTMKLAWSVTLLAGQVLFAQRVQENGPGVTLNGNWQMQMDANASGGGFASSNTRGTRSHLTSPATA